MSLNFLALSPMVAFVVGLLFVFSILSWIILVWKSWVLFRVQRADRAFLALFEAGTEISALALATGAHPDSPLAQILKEGWNQVPQGPESVARVLRRASTQHIEKLERGVAFLATSASSTPFIGLLGTVWGIMNAFTTIGQTGSVSLAVVAPGVAEALLTTALGLAVAIPAVLGFNFLQSRVRLLTNRIDNFSYDLVNSLQRTVWNKA